MCFGAIFTEFNTKRKDGISLRDVSCFLFMTSSQTPPDMSSTFSTLRHCTAMPLQVRIEEGHMSKAVRVSGLRYCQYSQEKIRLLILLSDLLSAMHLVVCYPDQQMQNIYKYIYMYIYINNILYIVSIRTCFDTSASSSDSLIPLHC